MFGICDDLYFQLTVRHWKTPFFQNRIARLTAGSGSAFGAMMIRRRSPFRLFFRLR